MEFTGKAMNTKHFGECTGYALVDSLKKIARLKLKKNSGHALILNASEEGNMFSSLPNCEHKNLYCEDNYDSISDCTFDNSSTKANSDFHSEVMKHKHRIQLHKMEKFRRQMDEIEKMLQTNYETYIRTPTTHPEYLNEWKVFQRRFAEKSYHLDAQPEWDAEWKKMMDEQLKKEIEIKKLQLKEKLRIRSSADESSDEECSRNSYREKRIRRKYRKTTSESLKQEKHNGRKLKSYRMKSSERLKEESRSRGPVSLKSFSPSTNFQQSQLSEELESHISTFTQSHTTINTFSKSHSSDQKARCPLTENVQLPGVSQSHINSPSPRMLSLTRLLTNKNLSPERLEVVGSKLCNGLADSTLSHKARFKPPSALFQKALQSTFPSKSFPAAKAYTKSNVSESYEPQTVLSLLSLLVALEDFLGCLAPKVFALMTEAIVMNKNKMNSSNQLLDEFDNVVLFETIKEKFKGLLLANWVDSNKTDALNKAIKNIELLIHEANERRNGGAALSKSVTDKIQFPQPLPSLAGSSVNEPGQFPIDTKTILKCIAEIDDSVIEVLRSVKRTSEKYHNYIEDGAGQQKVNECKTGSLSHSTDFHDKFDSVQQLPKDQNTSIDIAPVSLPNTSTSTTIDIPQIVQKESMSEIQLSSSEDDEYTTSLRLSEMKILIKKFDILSQKHKDQVIELIEKCKKENPERFKRLMSAPDISDAKYLLPNQLIADDNPTSSTPSYTANFNHNLSRNSLCPPTFIEMNKISLEKSKPRTTKLFYQNWL